VKKLNVFLNFLENTFPYLNVYTIYKILFPLHNKFHKNEASKVESNLHRRIDKEAKFQSLCREARGRYRRREVPAQSSPSLSWNSVRGNVSSV